MRAEIADATEDVCDRLGVMLLLGMPEGEIRREFEARWPACLGRYLELRARLRIAEQVLTLLDGGIELLEGMMREVEPLWMRR